MSFFAATKPQVFAHRGGCELGPENTLAAFDIGMATGADGLELDVHLAADGTLVVHHDTTLDRTTNGAGPIARLSSAELARIDAGYRFTRDGVHPFRGQGIGVPTLREVLRRYPGIPLIIEMKVDSRAMGEALAAELRRSGDVERVCVGSFGSRCMRAIREAVPELATSACSREVRLALYRSWCGVPVMRPPFGGYQVPEIAGATRVVSPRFVRHSHRAGLKVQVWVVNAPADMERLLDWGVDALISDRPDLALRARDARLASS